jgi:hypothetical protein
VPGSIADADGPLEMFCPPPPAAFAPSPEVPPLAPLGPVPPLAPSPKVPPALPAPSVIAMIAEPVPRLPLDEVDLDLGPPVAGGAGWVPS